MPTVKATLFASFAACAALGASVMAGRYAVEQLETRLVAQARDALGPQHDWLDISASGQQLTLSGAAPADDARTAALARVTAAGLSAVLLDRTGVTPPEKNAPARQPQAELGVEIVFGPGATTIFGTIPEGPNAADPFLDLAQTLKAAPMLSPQRGRVPDSWADSVALAVRAVGLLERGRVAVAPGRVEIRASAASDDARKQALAALEPAGDIVLDAEISAPRPVITPFSFVARLSGDGGWTVSSCAAATVEDRDRILQALETDAACELGLGAPSPDWAEAVVAGITALEDLGAGEVAFADTDIALTGIAGQPSDAFMRRTGELADALPEVFSLSVELPQPEPVAAEETAPPPPGFRVTRSPEGMVSMSGVLPDARVQATAQTVAEAQFGMGAVTNDTELGESLPEGWTAHVLTGLEMLSMVEHGTLVLAPGELRLSGTVGTMRVRDDIERILAGRLPSETRVVLDMKEAPRAALPPPNPAIPEELCAEQITLELARNRIDFPPSESDIDEGSLPVIDRIAEIMGQCPGARFEIAGHTDSQGRESSNMALSQARADAVLAALLERQVDTVFLYARGYGETEPVADNETEEGRAANRRIEFSLLSDDDADGAGTEAQEAAPDAPDAGAEGAESLGYGDFEPTPAADAPQVETPEAGGAAAAPEQDASAGEEPETEDAAGDATEADGAAQDAAPPVVSRAAQAPIDDLVDPSAETAEQAAAVAGGPARPRPRPEDLSE